MMVEQERRTFSDVCDFDVPCLAPCRKDALLVVIGRFNGNDVPECGELRGERQKEGDVLRCGEDDRKVRVVDAGWSSVKILTVCTMKRLTRILMEELEASLNRVEA